MEFARALSALLLLTSSTLAQEVDYAPEERLDAIDVQLIGTARSSIDYRGRAGASEPLEHPILLPAK